jgi:hypothetical protein
MYTSSLSQVRVKLEIVQTEHWELLLSDASHLQSKSLKSDCLVIVPTELVMVACFTYLLRAVMDAQFVIPMILRKSAESVARTVTKQFTQFHQSKLSLLFINMAIFRHCVLSGVQTKERTETCSNFTANSRLFFFLAVSLITFLVIVIVIIYQKNRSLQYRYTRIIEGKEPEDMNCGLTSDEEDEDPNQTRVFFNKKRNTTENGGDTYKVTVGKPIRNGQNALNEQELADFLSDSSD